MSPAQSLRDFIHGPDGEAARDLLATLRIGPTAEERYRIHLAVRRWVIRNVGDDERSALRHLERALSLATTDYRDLLVATELAPGDWRDGLSDEEQRVDTRCRMSCPLCGGTEVVTMPDNTCVVIHPCATCGEALRPLPGDCCVFCSFGDNFCPPIQTGMGCCG